MFKFAIVIFAVMACAAAKPGLLGAPLVYNAPAAVIAAPAPFVSATSSQVVARNYNGIASAPIIAPVAAPLIAKHFGASPLAYSAPWAYSSPLAYAAGAAPVLW